jgi:putative ABC transport system permease protein
VLADVKNVWQQFVPDIPFECAFMTERFNQLHQSDSIVGLLFSKFSILTILIALLGLFSMITHTILRKTKEIGIRKILGASEENIVWMLSADFLKRIIIANMIALPIAWILANVWLNTFAFKIELAWWIFPVTILGVLLLAVLTLGYQSIQASLANPVHNLRHE